MKTEDIDKKIGMPDVNDEWAKFESEVINKEEAAPKKSRRAFYVWLGGLGIAASLLLLLMLNMKEPQSTGDAPMIAQVQKVQKAEPVKEVQEVQPEVQEVPPEAQAQSIKKEIQHTAQAQPIIVENAGNLGSGNHVRLRGTSSMSSDGDDSPLIVLNGEILHLKLDDEVWSHATYDDFLQILDLENQTVDSIRVLKDASAVAVYGSQGGNGVIEITSKPKIKTLPDSLIAKVKAYEKKSDPNILVGRNPNKVDMREYEGLPSVSVDQALQGRIAGLKIENWSDEDKKDAKKIHELRKDSMIIVVNGKPVPDADHELAYKGIRQYLYRQGLLLSDSHVDIDMRIRGGYFDEVEKKEENIKKYGERAKYGVRELTAFPDTLCDAYVNKHPKLRKNYRRIQGYVFDENYKPLTNAWVNVWGKNAGAATGENGYFSFWMLKTDTLLEARNVGFRTTRFHPADTIIFIRLKDATTLRDVKVKARNRKNGLPIPYREVTGKINMEDFEGIKIKIDEVEDNTAYVVPASQIAPIIKKSSKKSQPKCITFKVDENLKALEKKVVAHYNGKLAAQYLLSQDGVKVEDQHVVAMSFADAQNLRIIVKDAFYQCMVKAYAEHKSVTLSPDMMWLLISQGFARYVNAHSEELRSQLVYHEGKQDLMVMTKDDLLSGKADWGKLMNDFSKEIERHTKGEVAKTIAADFSTTTPVERIASQITLMESMKSYFNYLAGRIGCGIPSITLQGTPDDWRAVLSKTQKLGQYGLSGWTQTLEPILNEFIKTAEGKPNQRFWQEMVKKKRVDEFTSVRPCSADKPTELDGWILKFFPTESGYTLERVAYTKSMPAEFVRVEFKYRVIDPITGATMSETPMELMSGFIGAKEDEKNNMLTPQIGWLVRACE